MYMDTWVMKEGDAVSINDPIHHRQVSTINPGFHRTEINYNAVDVVWSVFERAPKEVQMEYGSEYVQVGAVRYMCVCDPIIGRKRWEGAVGRWVNGGSGLKREGNHCAWRSMQAFRTDPKPISFNHDRSGDGGCHDALHGDQRARPQERHNGAQE